MCALPFCCVQQSFLIEITAVIFSRKDDLTDSGHVLDKILDKTGPHPRTPKFTFRYVCIYVALNTLGHGTTR